MTTPSQTVSPSPSHALEKAFCLLQGIAEAGGRQSLSAIAKALGIPLSTAHRLAQTLEAQGLVLREKRGYYHLGATLFDLAAQSDWNTTLVRICRPLLRDLARATRQIVHLGVFENDMVTYLIKESVRRPALFTRAGTQLEAYCTGIGKCLLASLPEPQLAEYLADGPFTRLTATTLTNPAELRRELQLTRQRGFAIDDGEMEESIKCIAMPLRNSRGDVRAAISIVTPQTEFNDSFQTLALRELSATVKLLEARLFRPHVGVTHPEALNTEAKI